MDPLSGSCYNLEYEEAKNNTKEKYFQILGSTLSISNYEEKNLKNLAPQIFAALLVTSYHIAIGISLAFSAILLPQLEENPEIPVSPSEASWIASVIGLTNIFGSLIVGVLMDNFGRLKTLSFAIIPGLIGCTTIALSQTVWSLIIGRAFIGFASGLGSSPAVVYLAEISRKDMRGSLVSLGPALTSLGMVLTFILGWSMTWRTVAWLTTIFVALPCLVFFLPESPSWLISKNRVEEAKESLIWINRFQPQPRNKTQSFAELQLMLLLKEHELKMIEESSKNEGVKTTFLEFFKPTGYKPLLILAGAFMFQQFSGIFVFLFYSINFFQEVGSSMNPYLASIFIGTLRFCMSMINTYVQKAFGRRPLMLISCFAMSSCLFLTSIFTTLVKNGYQNLNFFPVFFLLMFVVTSMIGVVPIPYPMTAELFPLRIRGVAHSVSLCIANFLLFLTVQLYPVFLQTFGGIANVLYFYGGVTLVCAIYVYIFLPETQGKKLSEIEEYFWQNVIYLGQNKEKQKSKTKKDTSSLVKNENQNPLLERV